MNRYLSVGLSLGLLAGCSPRHLIFTTYTTLGVDISATDAKPTKAVIGYKRFEGAIVPVDPDLQGGTSAPLNSGDGVAVQRNDRSSEAMSVYAAINMRNSWLKGIDVFQVFATGPAAVNAIRKPKALNALLEEIGRQSPTKPEDGDGKTQDKPAAPENTPAVPAAEGEN